MFSSVLYRKWGWNRDSSWAISALLFSCTSYTFRLFSLWMVSSMELMWAAIS